MSVSRTAVIQVALINAPYQKLDLPKEVNILKLGRCMYLSLTEKFTEARFKALRDLILKSVSKSGAKQVKISIEVEMFPEEVRKQINSKINSMQEYISKLMNKIQEQLSKDGFNIVERDFMTRERYTRGLLRLYDQKFTWIVVEIESMMKSIRGILTGLIDMSSELEKLDNTLSRLLADLQNVLKLVDTSLS